MSFQEIFTPPRLIKSASVMSNIVRLHSPDNAADVDTAAFQPLLERALHEFLVVSIECNIRFRLWATQPHNAYFTRSGFNSERVNLHGTLQTLHSCCR
jgi:hypothetical protein